LFKKDTQVFSSIALLQDSGLKGTERRDYVYPDMVAETDRCADTCERNRTWDARTKVAIDSK
jgi:hypothetical protein